MTSLKRHLEERGLTALSPAPHLCEVERVATFPLFNLSGEFVGYQTYRPDAPKQSKSLARRLLRYFTWVTKPFGCRRAGSKLAVWGTETLNRLGPVVVTEGVFDACKAHAAGYAAVACLSNDPQQLKNFFNFLSQTRTVVAVCDDDDAGRKLAKLAHKSVNPPWGFKDLGEMPQELATEFLRSALH